MNTSNVEPAVVSSILADIDAEYGKITKITITQEKAHKYPSIGYSPPGMVILEIINNIGNMLDDIPEDIKGE